MLSTSGSNKILKEGLVCSSPPNLKHLDGKVCLQIAWPLPDSPYYLETLVECWFV